MSVTVRARPFAHPARRVARLRRLSWVLLGLTGLALWDPLAHPGPKLCLMRHAVGLPCPLCGLTRGVSLSLRGRPLEASSYNPLAVPVLAAAVLLTLKWAVEFGTGRELTLRCPRPLALALVAAAHLAVLAAWAYLLVCRREDDFAACWLGRLLGK
jgi:hypothetical protein